MSCFGAGVIELNTARNGKHLILHHYLRACFGRLTAAFRIFFSVSLSQRRTLQIWWLLSFLQGAQSPQLSFRWQPTHSPHLFLFFFDPFSCSEEYSIGYFKLPILISDVTNLLQ